MRYCKFTPYLSSYSGDHESLEEHVRICPACAAALKILKHADQQSAEKTPDCPDGRELAFYVNGALPSTEAEAVSLHIASCGRCLRAIQNMVRELRDEHACESALEQSTREIQAHALARDLALWLSTEAYPREEAVVRNTFDADYNVIADKLREREPTQSAPAKQHELIGLGFSGTAGISLAQRINLLCAIAGNHRSTTGGSSSSVADALSGQMQELQDAGFGEHLLDLAIKHLRSME